MSRLRVLLAAGLVLAGVERVLGGYSIEEGGMRVVFPPDNRRPIKMALADFGKPRYGGSLIGQLVYPSSASPAFNFSSRCFPEDCNFGCSAFSNASATFPTFKIQREPGKFYIMLLDRGPRNLGDTHHACFFLDKVFNAQDAGADAVLVANDEPGEMSTAVAPEDDDTAKELLSLTISAAMVSLEDANFLRELLRNGPVTVLLNWTASVPQAPVVHWEFWTNSNDECGFSCREQAAFVRDMKDRAQSLEAAGQAIFTPHYLLWNCPAAFLNTTECRTECLMNGTYCVPDPDDDPNAGYSGRDVLLMNLRQLCFFRLASAAGRGSLWWDYAVAFASNCSMAAASYTPACAATVFDLVGGPNLVAGGGGRAAWDACAAVDEAAAAAAAAAGNANATRIAVLEEELAAQKGNDASGIAPVSILPTIRINGRQYRGSLDVPSVTRAMCAGFPTGREPAVCNAAGVSEDECAPGGVGYLACMSGDASLAGKTRCINTFAGYSCDCKDGMYKYTNPDTGEERCEDVNECLATNIPLTDPACACPRCACVNKVGSFKCTGPLDNKCKAENNYGGCWHNTTANGETLSACVDTVWEFQRMAARGLINETDPWFKCECPKCFRSTPGGCEPLCDLSLCDRATGFCVPPGGGGGGGGGSASGQSTGGGGGGGGKSSSGGVSGFGIALIALASAGLTAAIVLVANRYLLRQRMGDEIRDIMAQYMPLQEQRERNALLAARNVAAAGGGRGGGGGGGHQGRAIRPDEDSEDEGHVGAFGWPAAKPSGAAGGGGGSLLGPLGGGGGDPAAAAALPPAPVLLPTSQRTVWGPPPVVAAASTSAAKPAPAAAAAPPPPPAAAPQPAAPAAAARPSVDVFTIDDPSPLASSAAAAAAGTARTASDADPLLGRDVGSASAGGAAAKHDSPFL